MKPAPIGVENDRPSEIRAATTAGARALLHRECRVGLSSERANLLTEGNGGKREGDERDLWEHD